MRTALARTAAVLLAISLVGLGCSTKKSDDGSGKQPNKQATEKIDYASIGLWDDGPCDAAKPPLKIGLMVVFESPVISLGDQALALEAAAAAFNKRGGANGSCIKVFTCDDGANLDQSLACVKQIDKVGVVATVNDQGTAAQAEVAQAMRDAKIPRIAGNVTNNDWDDANAYPMDAAGTGETFLSPEMLLKDGIKKVGAVRVDLAAASALKTLLNTIFKDQGLNIAFDAPVPGGTTDFTQFILGAQDANVGGLLLALGEQEAVQVVKAGQQLGTKLVMASSLGSFPHKTVADLGDFATQMRFMWSYPPATVDLPVYRALRSDLAASGQAALQPGTLKASPMRSWIGLYALLKMIRDAKLTDFSRDSITNLLQAATDVDMLGIFGNEKWTPNKNHAGMFKRAGTNHWAIYKWDPDAKAPDGLKGGNFVESSTLDFDKVLCGSAFGGPEPC